MDLAARDDKSATIKWSEIEQQPARQPGATLKFLASVFLSLLASSPDIFMIIARKLLNINKTILISMQMMAALAWARNPERVRKKT
jgi:hypothetical protein